ncbi:hypothetical protein C2G38_2201166 [Gigaspora rosea]|uniref:Uncharacterized protein n=1 Tax=Gigaspora rosea TaxID=44941 RepID=A0A397URL2_9GLOM|nr:hypothetical protein C2G38_2201166 [Gigaspora rosea]
MSKKRPSDNTGKSLQINNDNIYIKSNNQQPLTNIKFNNQQSLINLDSSCNINEFLILNITNQEVALRNS